jgi:hypothetical protein
MGKIKIHSGDFSVSSFDFNGSEFTSSLTNTRLKISDIVELALASEENVKKVGGTLLGAAAGAVLLGPLGLLVGLLTSGNKKESTFIAIFSDGRKMLATAEASDYAKIQFKYLETYRANAQKNASYQPVMTESGLPCWSCGREHPTANDKCPYCRLSPSQKSITPCWSCGKQPGDVKPKCPYCK